MQFNSGIVGVLVVVFALIASVILGVVTNVDSQTVNKDVEEYVADITGGFTAGREKSYSDYNPSNNYNGYTNNTYQNRFAVEFEPSRYVNNYPLTYSENPIVFDVMDTTASNVSWGGSSTTLWYEIFGYRSVDTKANYESGTVVKCVKFSDFLPDVMPSNTDHLKYIEFSISTAKDSNGHATNTASILTGPNRMIYDESYAWIITSRIFGNTISADYSKAPYSNGENSPYYLLPRGSSNTEMIKIRYDVANDALAFYMSNGDTITTSPAADVYVTGTHTIHDYYDGDITTTSNINVSYSYEDSTQYIDTRYGVGVRNGEEVEWYNKQQNGVVSIAFSVWDELTNTFTDTGSYLNTGVIQYYDSADSVTFSVSRSGGRTYIAINGNTPVDIGTWKQIQMDIDTIDGKIIAYPISTWDNFNNYTLTGTSVEIGEITKGNLERIVWTANDSFRFEVINTIVFFNSYGVVLIDPYITITDLWPGYTRFMVSFTKVATVGSQITIGSTTYPITDNHISVNGTSINVTDMEVYFEKDGNDWDLTFESEKNVAKTVENSTYIGMTGTWYFNAGFYNVVTKQVVERVWNPVYDWFAGNLFFWMAGFTLVGGIISWKLGYADPLSILILIASEVILIIIGGAI